MNLVIINKMAKDVRFKRVMPSLISDSVRVVVLIQFPSITLLLSQLLG
jgi:hypothetical protein